MGKHVNFADPDFDFGGPRYHQGYGIRDKHSGGFFRNTQEINFSESTRGVAEQLKHQKSPSRFGYSSSREYRPAVLQPGQVFGLERRAEGAGKPRSRDSFHKQYMRDDLIINEQPPLFRIDQAGVVRPLDISELGRDRQRQILQTVPRIRADQVVVDPRKPFKSKKSQGINRRSVEGSHPRVVNWNE